MPSIIAVVAFLYTLNLCATEVVHSSFKSSINDNIVELKSIDKQLDSSETTNTNDGVTGESKKSVSFQLPEPNDQTSNISCFECDSNVSPDCLTNPEKTETCVSKTNECFTILSATSVMRGCIQSEHFITVGERKLMKCSDRSNCNDQRIYQEYCHSSIVPITQTKTIAPSKACPIDLEPVSCYHSVDYNAGLMKKGCTADLSTDDLESLRKSSLFKECVGNNCNARDELLSCASFVSRVYDDLDEKNIPTKVCKEYTDECYTYGSYWTIERGCLSDASEDIRQSCESSNTKCQKCSTQYCNMGEKILEQYCYTLKYKKSENIALSPKHSKRCYFARSLMGCYHVESSDGTIKKGCVADLNPTEVAAYSKTPNVYITCAGDNCNTRHKILSCLSCKSRRPNDECAFNQNKVPVKVCKKYHDKCYARIAANNFFERGCLHDASTEIANDCSDASNVRCKLCDNKSGCNDQYVRERCLEQEYQKGSVVVVSSKTSKRCSLQSKPTGCYHFQDKVTGIVRKGCVGDLSTEVLSDYIRQQPHFQACMGENCNWRYELFSCLSCKSTSDDSTCLSDIQHIDRAICNQYQDQCFLRTTGDTVERGCLSTVSKEIINECRTEKHKCITCNQNNNCNDDVKQHEHCYSMDSNPFSSTDIETVDKQPKSIKCNLSTYPMGCYHFENAERRIVRKGCVSDLKSSEIESYQQAQKQFFMKCSGDNCNSGSQITSCLVCKSNGVDGHCISDFTSAEIKACPVYGDKCYTRITTNNQYERGCLSEASEIVLKACNSNIGRCETCNENKCNDHIAADYCITCDSEFDEHCQDNPDKISQVHHCSMRSSSDNRESAGCYLKFNGKIAIRGCAEDLRGEDAHACNLTSSDKCQICKGHRCNERVSFHQSCFKCKSSVQSPCLGMSSEITEVRCANYSSSCVIGVDPFGHTHRTCGFGEQENKDNFPFGFRSCNGEQCNNFVFPENRLYCYRCEDCGKQLDPDQHMGICQIYSNTSRCYTFEKDGRVNRGCISDDPAVASICGTDQKKCTICEGRGCNDKISSSSTKIAATSWWIVSIIILFTFSIE